VELVESEAAAAVNALAEDVVFAADKINIFSYLRARWLPGPARGLSGYHFTPPIGRTIQELARHL
jgi:hypothetical protein